jgi:adenine-specific DNA-methyltransferase
MELVFDYSNYQSRISLVEQLVGKSGWMQLNLLQIETLETEEELIFTGVTDDGDELDKETCSKLLLVPARTVASITAPDSIKSHLMTVVEREKGRILGDVSERNRSYFESEMDKLEVWADDLKQGLERELKELDKEIREIKKLARQAATLEEKVELHKKSKDLEKKRNDKRRNLFEAQDEVDKKKEELLTAIETRLKQRISLGQLFTIRWNVA